MLRHLTRNLVLLAASITALSTFAQTPTFEVATIKPNIKADGRWRLQPTPDGYTAMGVSLFHLIQEAYGIPDKKLISGGPSWIDVDKFDLEAKFNAAEIPDANKRPYQQRADMLQPLLAERFKLKVHHETKVFPVFNLVLAKDGPKFQESKPESLNDHGIGSTCLFRRSRGGEIAVEGCSMANLADTLRYSSGRTVIDKTGLKGVYDFELRWTPDNIPADPSNANDPSIFTAVQEQLGLKLEPSTAPLDILVIDTAEQPTEN